jgi:hypothetical protein
VAIATEVTVWARDFRWRSRFPIGRPIELLPASVGRLSGVL